MVHYHHTQTVFRPPPWLLVILASKAEEEPRTSRKATATLRGGFPKRAGTSDSGTHILNTVIMKWKSTLVNQIACLRVEHLHHPDLPQAREAGSLSDKLVCHNSGPIGTKYDTGVPKIDFVAVTPRITTNPSTLYFGASHLYRRKYPNSS